MSKPPATVRDIESDEEAFLFVCVQLKRIADSLEELTLRAEPIDAGYTS